MKPRHFLTSLLAINLSFHILRFPHLILENGGGAFLILFFIALNALALPLLITEKVLDNKLEGIDLKSLISIHKWEGDRLLDHLFVMTWYGLRLVILICLLWFFLYLSGTSLVYLAYFSSFLTGMRVNVIDLPAVPDLEMGVFTPTLVSLGSLMIFYKGRKPFFKMSNQWLLPISFVCLLVLFFKIIISVKDFEALKVLFYPDFSALNRNSLVDLIGHSLVCLFVGFGFYRNMESRSKDHDPIEIFIHALIQTLLLALVIGVTALPMIQQVRETAFGSSWVFSILPRWLSYGEFGNYYCGLFFLCIFYLNFHISILITSLISDNMTFILPVKQYKKTRIVLGLFFVLINASLVYYLQTYLKGWSGQSDLLLVDHILIDRMVPVLALMMIWVVFRYTGKGEQLKVFEHQQVFYHNRVFFNIWRGFSLFVVPLLVVLAWLCSYWFKGS